MSSEHVFYGNVGFHSYVKIVCWQLITLSFQPTSTKAGYCYYYIAVQVGNSRVVTLSNG